MRPACLGIAALAVVIGGTVPAKTHHSHPTFYDQCTSVTIEGEIESVQWKNPHVLIDLTTTDGKAYRADWTSMGALERNKIEPPKAGDRVVITGNPMRDVAAIRARFPDVKLEPPQKPVLDVRQIRGVGDGLNWSSGPDLVPPNCGSK
jgi:hypothetical protein